MTDIEPKLNLPEPLKVKPSISKYLDQLEDEGKTVWGFEGSDIVEDLFYLHLMNKYKSKCVPKGTKRYIGIDIPLKATKYTKEDEEELKTQFDEIGKIIADCVKRGEKMILIPLSYKRGMSGHYNMLIYKVNNNEIEHFEPHGGEYIGNLKLQESSRKVMLYFVNILNKYLKRNGLHQAKYVEASQVCPYINGLQAIEGKSTLKKIGKLEPAGYCAAWGLFFAELNLKNPDLTSAEILDNIYNYLTTKESGPDYLKKVIRGYAGYIYQNVDRYLEIFFKPRVRLIDLMGASNRFGPRTLIVLDVMKVLINLEMIILSDPLFDYEKELKNVMKEYKKLTQGKTKEQQRAMRNKNINLANLYYKKRILQNYEEYKRSGIISEPVFDSPEDIRPEDIKDLTIIKRGHLHEITKTKKEARIEAIKKAPWGPALLKQWEEDDKLYKELKKKEKKTKGKKSSPQAKTKKLRPTKAEANIVAEIIKKYKIDMKTKEGQEKLLEILQRFAKK